jgi:hypothetical protein
MADEVARCNAIYKMKVRLIPENQRTRDGSSDRLGAVYVRREGGKGWSRTIKQQQAATKQ